MDGRGFDDFARRLARAGSRRSFLKATAATVAGVLGFSGSETALARGCRKGKQRCTDNDQCCSGQCLDGPGKHRSKRECAPCRPDSDEVTCDGRCGVVVTNNCGDRVRCPRCCRPEQLRKTCRKKCGPVANNCGEVVECDPCPCEPDEPEVTCNGRCGSVTNNCGDRVNCGLCPGEICEEPDPCGGGECLGGSCCADADVCQDSCCDPDRGEREGCCGDLGCCECFQNNAPGGGNALFCDCESRGRELCGDYPNDECCLYQDTCVDGRCTPIPQACPPLDNPTGANIFCQAGCCDGLCCPAGTVCDGNKRCVTALATCESQADCDSNHICTAFMGDPGICCPNVRFYEVEGTDGDITFLVPQCCFEGEENRDCDLPCVPVYYGGCSATFRGSQPRITS